MRVINFFAGPGAGKSTTAAALFALMKMRGLNVELVTEFPKECLYEGNFTAMSNQLQILGEHDRRLRRLTGKVDYAITDSPLLLGLVYARREPFNLPWFATAVRGAWDSYSNTSFFIKAVKPYQPAGRRESEASARALDADVRRVLRDQHYTELDGDAMAAQRAFDIIMKETKWKSS